MARKQSEALLASILATAVDAIIVIDSKGVIQLSNPSTERMFGYCPEEMVGQNITMLMPNPYRQEHDGYLEHYHATGQRRIIGIGREVQGKKKDGQVFPLHLAVSEVQTEDGKLFAGILRDISDLKEVERKLIDLNLELDHTVQRRTEQLEKAQAELVQKEKLATLGRVAGGIAHEIRNPLNAIKTSAYYLLNAKKPPESKVCEHLNRINRQVCLMDSVITALSEVSRNAEPALAAVDLLDLLMRVIADAGIPKNIAVSSNFPDQVLRAFADRDQLAIVFRNLIRNAVDAMPNGGKLELAAVCHDSQIMLKFTDTGVGIAPDQLDRVMEPFYSTKARGLGLGLSITRAIVEQNRGTLQVKSEVAVGTTFTLTLQKFNGE